MKREKEKKKNYKPPKNNQRVRKKHTTSDIINLQKTNEKKKTRIFNAKITDRRRRQ